MLQSPRDSQAERIVDRELPLFHLGHGTTIRVVRIGEVCEQRTGATVPFDYHFVKRGKLSRYQVKKCMSRWFMAVLRNAIHQADPSLYSRQVERDRKWQARNLRTAID